MSPRDGGDAFPSPGVVLDVNPHGIEGQRQQGAYGGMSLRDYFAAKALPVAADDELKHPTYDEATYKGTAERAYLYADAMLEVRES